MLDSCGGCPYHSLPYKSQVPVLIDGKRDEVLFTCKEDVWDIIEILIEEINETNKKGKEFDVAKSIASQLPFFTCINNVLDRDIQQDIQRYLYCKELGVSPYKGFYGEHPATWIDTFFIIKTALAKRESSQIAKENRKKG